MTYAMISALILAASGGAPLWIVGWIVVLAVVIGLPIYFTRRRRNRGNRGPQ